MTLKSLRTGQAGFVANTLANTLAATLATGLLLFGGAAHADSFASSASSAGSASVGSLSDSITGSSNASSGKKQQAAAGDYRVLAVAEVQDRPGMLRLALAPLPATGSPDQAHTEPTQASLWLTLPQQALAQRPLAAGDQVRALPRPYGMAFAHAADGEAFFLVLADADLRGLSPRPLAL